MAYEITPARRHVLAALIPCNEQYLYQCLRGLKEMDAAKAMRAETVSGGELRVWMLCQKTWQDIWPTLIGTAGAPPIEAKPDEAAEQGGRAPEGEHAAANIYKRRDDAQAAILDRALIGDRRRDGPNHRREGR